MFMQQNYATGADEGWNGGCCRFVSSALRNVNIEHGVEFLINEILHEEMQRMTGEGLSDISGGPIVNLGAWNSYDPNDPNATGYCC